MPARLSAPSAGLILRGAASVVALLVGWRILDALLPRGMPAGIVVLGMVFGSLYALNAIGLVLVYRANRVVNFAQAEFGSVAAVLAIVFVVHWRWNYFAGLRLRPGDGRAPRRAHRDDHHPSLPQRVTPHPGRSDHRLGAGARRHLDRHPAAVRRRRRGQLHDPHRRSIHGLPGDLQRQPLDDDDRRPCRDAGARLISALHRLRHRRPSSSRQQRSRRLARHPRSRPLHDRLDLGCGLVRACGAARGVSIVGFTSFSSVSGGGASLLLFTLTAAVLGRMESLPLTALAAIGLGVFQEVVFWNWSNATLATRC